MKQIIKAVLIFFNLMLFIGILFTAQFVLILLPKRRTLMLSYIVHIFSRIMVFIMGVRARVIGDKDLFREKSLFLVSNHLSYIEGIVASSIVPLAFIGRADLKRWPLLGVLALLSDTIFVKRNTHDIHRELKQMVSCLKGGVNLIFFPEGTSGDGTRLMPFKASFFEAPIEAESKIVPLAIRYLYINGQRIDERNKDLVYWYGNMEFFPHLLGVLRLNNIDLEFIICDAMDVSTIESDNSSQRKRLSSLCRQSIEDKLDPDKAVEVNSSYIEG